MLLVGFVMPSDRCPTCNSFGKWGVDLRPADKIVGDTRCFDPWHQEISSTPDRPEDVVACLACGKGPGASCEGPRSHPMREAAYEQQLSRVMPGRFEQEMQRARDAAKTSVVKASAADWVINNIQVGHRCGFCGKPFEIKEGHTCSEAAISPGGKTFLTAVGMPDPMVSYPTSPVRMGSIEAVVGTPHTRPPLDPPSSFPTFPKRCPSCGSPSQDLRYGSRPAILINGEPPPAVWCKDPWHDVPVKDDRIVHGPRIGRTLNEGPGNRTMVRGCSCGAPIMSVEAYAEHVGWPVEGVRAVLNLAGLADDLILYHEKMTRRDVGQLISRFLEVRR